jgi:hypothetical protein
MTDDELDASFDAAMRDTLDAGEPGPAQVASEASLRRAYAGWSGRPVPSTLYAGRTISGSGSPIEASKGPGAAPEKRGVE